MIKAHLSGVATSSKGLLQEERDLPTMRTSDGFDLDAYKLIEESGYNSSKPPSPRHVTDAKPYGPNDMKKWYRNGGDEIVSSRIDLGYMPH